MINRFVGPESAKIASKFNRSSSNMREKFDKLLQINFYKYVDKI